MGDLYISFHVKAKAGIWRDGLNLISKINIHYTDAILGTVLKVIINFVINEHACASRFSFILGSA